MKLNLIKQEQSLKNVYNDHSTSKWSSEHIIQLLALQKSIACPTHNQCKKQEVFASRIWNPIRAQVCSTKDNATKSKSTKKCYKARIQKQSTEHKLKVLKKIT